MLRALLVVLVCAALAAGGLFVAAGRTAPPTIAIDQPGAVVGQLASIDVAVTAPGGRFASVAITLEQNGRTEPLFALEAPQGASVTRADADHLRVSRAFGKQAVPSLQSGKARIVVTASSQTFLKLRTLSATASKDVEIRLEPPKISVLSSHHYLNHGGSEMVVYKATPAGVPSGVRVGAIEYPGYPASGAGAAGADPTTMVAFFALLPDQELNTPVKAFARDEAGNEATTSFIDNVFDKKFRQSRIEVDEKYFAKVVPDILEHSPELKMAAPSGDLEPAFLKVNGDLRRMNADTILQTTSRTAASRLWSGPFVQLGNSQVEASFADFRTYVRDGKPIDRQVHLGFDLAATANTPVVAANAGVVLHASWLGIYGNCVIVDHGMGVASLYGHLSSIDVKVGDHVSKGQVLGKTGMTGLAGGDHLHFTMLVAGHAVNPVEWWDPHWIQDRVDRKLQELSGGGAKPVAAPATPSIRPSTTRRRAAAAPRRRKRP